MSRELLKRVIAECSDEGSRSNITTDLYCAITEYLEMPEPEPVAWALFSKELMPTGAAYAIRRVEIQLAQIESDLDIQDAKIRPLYTTPTDQSAQIAALKHELQQADEDYVAVEEAYLQCQKDLYDETEKLAALQAKREPLSDEEIQDIHNELPSRSTYYEFARAIEAAHGIGEKHE